MRAFSTGLERFAASFGHSLRHAGAGVVVFRAPDNELRLFMLLQGDLAFYVIKLVFN